MQITSSAFENGAMIPAKHTCDGEGISPQLMFADVPPDAKALALIMDDPDVPANAGVRVWDHWVVFNIQPGGLEIPEGQNPQGILGKNTRGELAYGAPCPPDREHRYFFKLYALGTVLDLKAGATKAEVERAMSGHVISSAQLIGLYERKR